MGSEDTQEVERGLAELKSALADLKKRNPAHCSGTGSFVGHQMSPELYQQIEDLEEEVRELEALLAQR